MFIISPNIIIYHYLQNNIILNPPKKKKKNHNKGRADEEERRIIEDNIAAKENDDDQDEPEIDEFEYYENERICPDYEFECISDQKCISMEKRCNYVVDCLDGSDESMCAITPTPGVTLHTESEGIDLLSWSTTSIPLTSIDTSSSTTESTSSTANTNYETTTFEDKGENYMWKILWFYSNFPQL